MAVTVSDRVRPSILSFGEVLWDVFNDSRVIGGAPFNFAAHASMLGAFVTFVSAVGEDELGKAAKEQIRDRGMSDACTAVLREYPTGYCRVTLQNGTPSYELARDVAYDHIPFPDALPERTDALYCGTLASRMEDSKATLVRLLHGAGAREVFFDVNIRGNDWSRELLETVLPFATVLKFSREEAQTLADALEVGADGDVCTALCKQLSARFGNLRQVLVTLDKDGAFVYRTADGTVLHAPKPQSKAVSTVGAGDSFSACYLYNLLCGVPTDRCLARATALSDYVVTQLGAVPDYTEDLLPKIK